MRIPIEIITTNQETPYECMAMFDANDEELKLKWNQRCGNEKKPSLFELNTKKDGTLAVLKRNGEISTELNFTPGKDSQGKIHTAYGTMYIDLQTKFINLPSALCPLLQICYYMQGSGEKPTENNISIKLLLQKENTYGKIF